MSLEPQNTTSLVVAEQGGNWASWVERFQKDTPDVVVVLQDPDEAVDAFAMRVRARVASLQSAGDIVDRAVIVGGGRRDSGAMSARSLVIRAIAAAMVPQGRGNLVLDGQGTDRFAMTALATTVASQVRGTGVSVRPSQAPAFADVA